MKIRVNIEEVEISKISANSWNPNKQSDFIFEKERASIREYGFLDPILVREKGKKFEIIDGEHRFKAAIAEGFKKIPVNNLGKVSDEVCKQLTVIMNETRGQADHDLLSTLMKDLESTIGKEKLIEIMPIQNNILEDMLKQTAVDWDAITPSLNQTPVINSLVQQTDVSPEEQLAESGEEHKPSRVIGEQARYQHLKIDNDIAVSLIGQLKRLNKFLANGGAIPEEELDAANYSMAFQVMTQHFAEMTDKQIQKLLKRPVH